MKPEKAKIRNQTPAGRRQRTCCGTLSYIAECRGAKGAKKLEPIRRQSPPGTGLDGRI